MSRFIRQEDVDAIVYLLWMLLLLAVIGGCWVIRQVVLLVWWAIT